MDLQKKYYAFFFMLLSLMTTNLTYAEEEEGEEEIKLIFNEEERSEYGLILEKVEKKALSEELSSPGEVIFNAYTSSKVAPRIAAQVITRHARLGEKISKGQRLVTLSSVEMANAQGELLIASAEWNRVKALGREAVSGRRYIEARVVQQQAIGKVTAFGMTKAQINALLKTNDASRANGMFDLLSSQNGTIINDEFIVGEQIESGRVLFDISDESTLWVEARVAPEKSSQIAEGATARISRTGLQWIEGTVVQVHHRTDETTRTQNVRIHINNKNGFLHPGEFVETRINIGAESKVLAVPVLSVIVIDDQQVVFKLKGEEFHPEPVVTGDTIGDWIEVKAGLKEGDVIVKEGTYVLKSLLLKSKIGDDD